MLKMYHIDIEQHKGKDEQIRKSMKDGLIKNIDVNAPKKIVPYHFVCYEAFKLNMKISHDC